jgi:hypothetical protein
MPTFAGNYFEGDFLLRSGENYDSFIGWDVTKVKSKQQLFFEK